MQKPIAVIASLALAIFAPAALAEEQQPQQQEPGVTSGPAAGAPVEPSGAVQKDNPNMPDTDIESRFRSEWNFRRRARRRRQEGNAERAGMGAAGGDQRQEALALKRFKLGAGATGSAGAGAL